MIRRILSCAFISFAFVGCAAEPVAKVSVDLSEPAKTVRTLFTALDANDPNTAEKTFITARADHRAIHDMVQWIAAQARLDQAVARRLGNEKTDNLMYQYLSEGRAFAGDAAVRGALERLPEAKVEITGNKATLVGPGADALWVTEQYPFVLKKVDNNWVIDSSMFHIDHYPPDQGEGFLTMAYAYSRIAPRIDKLADDIDQGKYKTEDEIHAAVEHVLKAAESYEKQLYDSGTQPASFSPSFYR